MNIQDVLTLAKAGFTAEQIAALTTEKTPEEPAPVKEEPKAEPEPAPVKEEAPDIDAKISTAIDARLKGLEDQLAAIKTNAAMFTPQPGGDGEPDFDAVMASILDPTGSPLKR